MEDFTMDELLEVLKRAVPKGDWFAEGDLVDDGIIDSIDIISAIAEITDEFDIRIPSDEMKNENFNSVQAIYDLVKRLLED